jgi:zinc D-Ala-D-Ala carboxypeptidase
MKLSEHFTLDEFTASQTASRLGIDNTPPSYILPNINRVAQGMEKVRALLGAPIAISSGYRCGELNKAVGSKTTSQHTTGSACDFICPQFGDPSAIVKKIVNSDIDYDQVIQEYSSKPGTGWVHISFSDRNRKQALIIDQTGTRNYA